MTNGMKTCMHIVRTYLGKVLVKHDVISVILWSLCQVLDLTRRVRT